MAKVLTSKEDNYAQWYNDLVLKSGLAENSGVRGCMVIKPYGYAIWEKMRDELDRMFRATGHENAYFPMLIPKSFFSREADHVEGFAKECAVVTHYRLMNDPEKGGITVDPEAKLEEELIIRPTSETIIWNSYKNWIQSYRDLPILINQWANVVRWEMRTRLFLRTAEFLWQEGHTAHATREEAVEETMRMIRVYAEFTENFLAIPVIMGSKTESEKFAGAVETLTLEAMTQDGKALQAGTSHFLGQNFARAFDVQFTSKAGTLDYVWATSWGMTTRMIGALIMAHSDDSGLVLPPRVAPIQVVIVPIYKGADEFPPIAATAERIRKELTDLGIQVKFDARDTHKPGWKFAEYELKGVPLRIALGPRDIEQGTVELARRDTLEKQVLPVEGIAARIPSLLEEIQEHIYQKALQFREANTHRVENWDELVDVLEHKGGFALAHWDGTKESEDRIRETKATIRCIPLDYVKEPGKCVASGKPSGRRVLIAKAY
jgi:prolyl-tRNA synthetase